MAKYKVLKAFAHNFSHSFVSLMNYVDDGYVIDDLREIVKGLKTERLSIHWIPEVKQSDLLNIRILKSIAHRKEGLPRHVSASGAEIKTITEFRTDVFLKNNKQIAVVGILTDDRGRTYIAEIFDF